MPHIACCNDLCDIDVNNMVLKKGDNGIGLRMKTHKPDLLNAKSDKFYSITLDSIIQRCQKNTFILLYPEETKYYKQRIQKMVDRKWTYLDHCPWVPMSKKFTLKYCEPGSEQWNIALSFCKPVSKFTLKSVQLIQSSAIRDAFEVEAQNISKKGSTTLIHGTKTATVEKLLTFGFDQRYWYQTHIIIISNYNINI